jgi:hypothetical protein
MLGSLRKHSRSVIIYVLFGIIIVVFVFTFNMGDVDVGCGGKDSQGHMRLARVGSIDVDTSMMSMGLALTVDPPSLGAELDFKTYQADMMYRSTRFARFRGDPKYLPYVADPRSVSTVKVRKVVDDLQETLLVSEEALGMGLRVAPEEIRDRIVAEFTDPTSGQFRKKSYENFVRYGLRTSLGRFEDFVRREILREKMIDLVVANVVVTDREAREVARAGKTTRSYEYVEIDPNMLAGALVPPPSEVIEWFRANEAKVRKYFDDNPDEFTVQPGFDFHVIRYAAASKRILATIEDASQRGPLQATRVDARERAEAAAKELAGLEGDGRIAAFERLARTQSDDSGTKDRGGRVFTALDVRAISTLYDPLVATTLAGMEPGSLSQVLEGDGGYYILYLNGIRPGSESPFEDVRATIAAKLLAGERAQTRTDGVAADVLARVQAGAGRPLADIVAEANAPFAPAAPVRLGETGPVPEVPASLTGLAGWSPDEIPGIGSSAELAAALKSLTPESPVVGQVHRMPEGDVRFVLRLKDASDGGEATAQEIDAARRELLPLKRQAAWREWYQSLRTKAVVDGKLVEQDSLNRVVQEEIRTQQETLESRKGKPVSANEPTGE